MQDWERFRLPSDNPASPFYMPPPQPQVTTWGAGTFRPADPNDFSERMARYLPTHPAHPFYAAPYEPLPPPPPDQSAFARSAQEFSDKLARESAGTPPPPPPAPRDPDGLPPRPAPWEHDPWADMRTPPPGASADLAGWISASREPVPGGYEPPAGLLGGSERRDELDRAFEAFGLRHAERVRELEAELAAAHTAVDARPPQPAERERPVDPTDFTERIARYPVTHVAHPFYAPPYDPAVVVAGIDPDGYLPFNPMLMTSDLTAVDTSDWVNPRDRNALDYGRDARLYWQEVLERDLAADPDERVLSDMNRSRIERGDIPIVDWLWAERHPATRPYLDEPLRHHHWDQGPIAFAIPEKVHHECSALLHWVTSGREGPR